MMFLMPSRRKRTEMKLVLEFSPLGFCAGLLKSKFILGIPRFYQHLQFSSFQRVLCLVSVGEGADACPVGQKMGSGSHPAQSRQAQVFLNILPRQIIQILPYSSCTFSLSN